MMNLDWYPTTLIAIAVLGVFTYYGTVKDMSPYGRLQKPGDQAGRDLLRIQHA